MNHHVETAELAGSELVPSTSHPGTRPDESPRGRYPLGYPPPGMPRAPGTTRTAWPLSELDVAETVRLLVDIARPRVIALVVFTGLPALLLGKSEWPSLATSAWVLLGTALAGGASSAFNAVIERDSDARMARTKRRPLPAAALLPRTVLTYGALLTLLSSVILWSVGGPLATGVALATILFYVGVYTVWLKPRTPQNIVIGGAAGSTAPLIVSAAMDGHISPAAWILFSIIFLWTPPHFWAIAIHRRGEYESAGFPMMPLVIGDQRTRVRSLLYTIALVATTLLPSALGYLGPLYTVSAATLGVWFGAHVVRSMIAQRPAVDHRVFKVSVLYLGLLFLVMFVDLAIAAPSVLP